MYYTSYPRVTLFAQPQIALHPTPSKVLFAHPLEYFKYIGLRPQNKIFSIKNAWAYFKHGDNFVQAKKSIHFDRIKRPKFGEGSGSDKLQFGVGRKPYPS